MRPTEAKIRATKTIKATRVVTMFGVGGVILAAAVLLGNALSSRTSVVLDNDQDGVSTSVVTSDSINQFHEDALKMAADSAASPVEELSVLVKDPSKCQFVVDTENGSREEVHSQPEFLHVAEEKDPSIYTLLRFAVRAPKGCGEIRVAGGEVVVSNSGGGFIAGLVGGEQGESDNVVNLLKVRDGFAGDQVFWFPFNATLKAGETRVYEVRILKEEVTDEFADLGVFAVLQNPIEYYPEESDKLPQPFRVIIPNLPIR